MNKSKPILLAIAVAAVLLGGAYGIVQKRSDDNAKQANKSSQQDTKPTQGKDDKGRTFPMVSNVGLSFKARHYVQDANGTELSRSIMEHDLNNHNRLTNKDTNGTTSYVFSGEVTYECKTQSCEKLPWGDNRWYTDNTDDQFAYHYYQHNIDASKDVLKYKGKEDCPAGRCDVWSHTQKDEYGSTTQIFYLDEKTNLISQKTTESANAAMDEETFELTDNYVIATRTRTIYEYTPVTITIPPVPSEVPSI